MSDDNDNSDDDDDNDLVIQVNQTQAQMEAIEQEIKRTQPLTSEKMPVPKLKELYIQPGEESSSPSNNYFERGIDALSKTYSDIRTIRGDGNCYYRAFLYQLSERLLENKEELQRVSKYAKDSNLMVTSVGGYDEMTMEIFYDCLVEFMESLGTTTTTTAAASTLHSELNQESATSDYCTWYLRVITATYLKADPDRFIPYLEDGYVDIAAFCQAQIEPMGRECGMVQVLALAEAFSVRVTIEYLDGHEFKDQLTKHEFGPETAKTKLYMLYRPGHYDILYPKE